MVSASLLAGTAVFVTQLKAQTTLTNGLVAYWPMDTISSSVITPDLGTNSFDLKPYSGNAVKTFNGANITLINNVGPHFGLPNAQNGTNALATHSSQSTLLAFVYNPSSVGDMCTNMQLPQLNLPNWTMSFWVRAGQGGANSSPSTGRFWACSDTYNGNPLNTFWDFDGDPSDPTQIQHFTRQNTSAGGLKSGFQFADDNPGGDASHTTNVLIWDTNWHNVTITCQTTTNGGLLIPGIDPTQFGSPTNGSVLIAYTNLGPLDSIFPNWTNEVNTNQTYHVEVATNMTGPWTSLSQFAGTGTGGSGTFTDSSPTNQNAFYRIQMPGVRLKQYTLYVDHNVILNSSGAPWASTPKGNGATFRTNGYMYYNTFEFGGFFRAAGEGGFVDSLFSDAAVWSRVLSSNEISGYIVNGITNIGGLQAPVFANLSAEYPATAQGDTDLLSWSAAKPPATLTLNPGSNDVTPLSILGGGSTNAPVSSNTLFQLVATRGTNSASASVPVICVSNVAPNWHYIDSFTYLNDGPISGQGNWLNPSAGPATGGGQQNLVVYTSTGGNNYAGFDGFDGSATPAGNGGIAGRGLGSFSSTPGNTNSAFFRFYIDPAATNTDPIAGSILAFNQNVLLSDVGTLDPSINGGIYGGPEITISQAAGGGAINLTASSGASGIVVTPGGYDYTNDPVNGDTNGLIAGHVYSVWVDIINNYPGVVGGFGSGGEQTNAAFYAVWLQRDDWAQRTNLFSSITCTNTGGLTMNGTVYPTGYLLSARDYSTSGSGEQLILGPSPNIRNFEIRMDQATTPQRTNAIRYDDFYISVTGTGFNSTAPVPAGDFAP